MIDIARGRRPADDVDALLSAAPGVVTSRPSPAAGLCLVRIYYDQHELAAESLSAGGPERHG
jgi:tRNA U38,U39,U40 pseudouridine synthase TruA